MEIIKAKSPEHVEVLEKMAAEIWRQYYVPIIGIAQVEYMLGKFQSIEAIQNQIDGGQEYYLLKNGNVKIGYFSFYQKGENLFLSKIYIHHTLRSRGYGKRCMDFIMDQAAAKKLKNIELTVNKYNIRSIEVYKKLGFHTIGSLVMDIGGGFVMDDFVLRKKVK